MIHGPSLHAAINHAREVFPQESCGIVVDDEYIPLANTHARPTESFSFPATVLIEYDGRIQYLVHSHPGGPSAESPSSTDMRQQAAMGVPWIIIPLSDHGDVGTPFVFGTGNIAPLEGRAFRHGVHDCYAIIHDAFALGRAEGAPDIEPHPVPDYPRDWGWWTVPGVDLYEKNFADAGFLPIGPGETPRAWDVLLCAVGSAGSTPNHAILYLGNSIGLHHVGSWRRAYDPSRLSTRENIARWNGTISRIVRPAWL